MPRRDCGHIYGPPKPHPWLLAGNGDLNEGPKTLLRHFRTKRGEAWEARQRRSLTEQPPWRSVASHPDVSDGKPRARRRPEGFSYTLGLHGAQEIRLPAGLMEVSPPWRTSRSGENSIWRR